MPSTLTPEAISLQYAQQCASEAIQQIGTVQPHGFVVVVSLQDGRVVQASTGAERHWLGAGGLDDLLGSEAGMWFDAGGAELMVMLQSLPQSRTELMDLQLRHRALGAVAGSLSFECLGHRTGQHAMLEWVPAATELTRPRQAALQMAQINRALMHLREADSMVDFLQESVAQLQGMSGYDRVMIYRFRPDWTGEIVAEATAPNVASKYMGLRFPATDIPPQARRLYESNTLRVLCDVEAVPDPLVPPTLPGGTALDQSHSLLRSLAQSHLVYLRNMAVQATLVISLLKDGKLWGMIACHHHAPRVPPYHLQELMRTTCELIANVVALRIDDLVKLTFSEKTARLKQDVSQVAQALAHREVDALGLCETLAGIPDAFGVMDVGIRLPSLDWVSSLSGDASAASARWTALLDWAGPMQPGELRQWSDVGKSESGPPAGMEGVAGLALYRLPASHEGYGFMSRPPVSQTVDWAGEPGRFEAVSRDGGIRLEPRRSFALWREQVQGQAEPLDPPEEESLRRLMVTVSEAHKNQLNRELQNQLQWRASHDLLTGLLNRSVIENDLRRLLEVDHRSLAVFMVDLDHFKEINDSQGHAVGDLVLQELSRRLLGVTREHDIVARLGGDEFLVLTPLRDGDTAAALAMAARLHDTLRTPLRLPAGPQTVHISVGIACGPEHGADAGTLLRHADIALYEAKALGRSRSVLYEPALEAEVLELKALEVQLQEAVSGDQLRLHFQPKVELATGQVIGLEALVRWLHPQRGLLGPNEFTAIAERSQLIMELGRWVLEESARQLRRWQDEGQAIWPVAVNVSFAQVVSGHVEPDLRRACELADVAPRWLELELTESVVMENTQQALSLIRAVRSIGVKVALDDFGTGYSSLAYIRQLPLDALKIDRSFITSLLADPQAEVVARGIIGLSNGLNMLTIAEGVETPEQRDWLARNGCEIGQGYLFSRPVPPHQVHEAVRTIEGCHRSAGS